MVSQHIVRFFGVEETAFLQELVAYVSDGLKRGEPVIVITERSRKDALSRLLGGRDDETQLCILEAEQMLAAISSDDGTRIDGRRFDAKVGSMLRDLVSRSRSRRVRAYGDMVGILWKDGRREMAVELERYWNDLQAQIPFDLYCGYAIEAAGEPAAGDPLRAIIAEHTHVIPAPMPRECPSAPDCDIERLPQRVRR
jgi:hypothetical protein